MGPHLLPGAPHNLSALTPDIYLRPPVKLCGSQIISEGPKLLSGVPDFFDRNKILNGGDLSHYQVPHCIRVFFYFV